MPFGEFINFVPPWGFLLIHIALFVVGALMAQRSFAAEMSATGAGFSLFCLAEISYMTYHLDWTTFLFAHTISEILMAVAFVTIFATTVQRAVVATHR